MTQLPAALDEAGRPRGYPKDRTFRATDGARIAYTMVGEGDRTPVVLVPGLCCTDTYVAPLVPGLNDAGHPVLIIDNRGHFDSGLPRRPGLGARRLRRGDVSPTRMGRDVIEMLDDAGVERAAVAGHSLGVQILFEAYRVGRADRVAALVPIAGTYENPVSTFADRDLNHLFNIFEVIRPWLPFEALGWLVSRIQSPKLGAALVQKVGAGGANITAELMQPHVDRIKDANFAVMFRVISEMRDHSAADLLEDLDVPLLVCAGGADTFTPPSIQKRMVELAPNAELALWDDATHFLPVDKTDEVVERIHTFLAERVGSQTNV